MTVTYGKKVRNRRSLFGLWIPNKTVVTSKQCNPSPADSAVSDSPASEPIPASWSGRDRLKIRLTRSGSKILLLLGLGTSSNSNKTSVDSGSCEDPHILERNQDQCALSAEQDSRSPDTPESPISSPLNPPRPEISGHSSSPEVGSPSVSGKIPPVEVVQPSGAEVGDNCCNIVNNQHGSLNPTLVGRFSRGLSLTWGQHTVIRRSHLRSRPNIIVPESPTFITPDKHGDGAHDSSGPSTTPSSSGSPVGCSTPPTPVTSPEPSPSSDKYKATVSDWTWSDHASDVNPTLDSGSQIITPSIRTVETASVAKIFLELYFRSTFQNLDPRMQRRHELEQYIFAFQPALEEQMTIRHNWLLQENEYLRRCRNLKTNVRCTEKENVSTTEYEFIKILGKGSFGVVRLVRERGSAQPLVDDELSSRSSPLERIRSAVDVSKHGRRKLMTGEKKEVYAMKVIRKSDMIRNSQEGHIRAERDFLVASEKSRWVVPLITSFQDSHNLYLVMDYMVGGDFLGLLIRKDVLREESTRFYVAEMILCIEEAHRLCWIHRDVKPDNFLISASGHLKISDFGLAFNGHWSHDQTYYNNHRYSLLDRLGIDVVGDAEDQANAAVEVNREPPPTQALNDPSSHQLPATNLLDWRDRKERRRFARSVVGTSQYMAPEVIRGEMYDGRCDWWSLGIILYECFYGFTPFACENRHDTKLNILQHSKTLKFPREKQSDKAVPWEAIDLIHRILQERELRLCSQKYRANDILTGRPASATFLYTMDSQYRNIASYFVYPNDAADIKAHPFFRGIRWNELHLTQAPHIPKVKNWEDTRYFDDWRSIGDIDEASNRSDSEDIDQDLSEPREPEFEQENGPQNLEPRPEQPDSGIAPAAEKHHDVDKQKEKKRPRDKILRDKKAGRTALEIRKRGAFLGYTWRRPRGPAMALGTDRGRQLPPRGHLGDLYVL